MAGLFYDIQSMFKATYSGRYIAVLLAELFRRSPEDFSAALNAAGIAYKYKKSDNVVANRWPFPAKKGLRFADLAVLNSAGDPLVLVEIKDADIKSDTNAAQIDDYLQFLEKRADCSVQFLFLSRTVPPEDAESKLRAASHKHHVRSMLFSRLYAPLKQSNPFSLMLRSYLEDINVVYYDRRPDAKAIQYVTRSLLGFGGMQATEKSVPEFFDVAFKNLSSIGQWIQNDNPKLFKHGFKRRLYIEPWHDVSELEKLIIGKDKKKALTLKKAEYLGEYCNGGEVCFYSSGYLTYNTNPHND